MEQNKLPRHVGIIMDGNGRWAEARGKERSFGHKHGSANVDRIVEYAFLKKGVFALTLYAFSAENYRFLRRIWGFLLMNHWRSIGSGSYIPAL